MNFIHANYYFNMGFNVTCIINEYNTFNRNDKNLLKTPSHRWSYLQKKRQDIVTLKSYEWNKSVGLGVVLGFNNLRALDIDGCENFVMIYDFLEILNFPTNYKWVVESGSKKGFHIIFYAENHKYEVLENKIKVFKSNSRYKKSFKHIELRWIGHLVLPPSSHLSCMNYQFLNGIPLDEPSHLNLENLYVLLTKYCSGRSLNPSGVHDGNEEEEQSIDVFGDPKAITVGFIQTNIKFDLSLLEDLAADFNTVIDKERPSIEYNNAPYYLFFDTETTGIPNDWDAPADISNNWPRLVQLAWLLYDGDGKLILENKTIVKPDGFSIPKEASDVHGITTDYALNHGIDLANVLKDFQVQCYHSHYLIAHNINFDSKVMTSEFLRTFLTNPLKDKELLCTMESSTDYCKIESYRGYKWPKLSELYFKLFDEDFEGAHDALADIKATARCFWKMRELKLIKTVNDIINENPSMFSL